ncbi:unnamed protein product [Polarella glacialis]|uniref:Uncharacterized protein n=1 Tax=Polarella glacialis TaxID=89957 RepID=A0A813HY42_POLGL|nr:unnamed protein product [Polarella glacialis]
MAREVSSRLDALECSRRAVASPASARLTAASLAEVSLVQEESPEPHPWLLADGRLQTARLEGENVALKRAVMKARSEIDDLLRGRAVAEARVMSLAEENMAAAEALRTCAGGTSGPAAASPSSATALKETSAERAEPRGACPEAGSHAQSSAATSLRRLLLLPESLGELEAVAPVTVQTLASPSMSRNRPGSPLAARSFFTRSPSASSQTEALGSRILGPGLGLGGGDSMAACNNSSLSLDSQRMGEPDGQARTKLLQTSDEICRRMEAILARRGKNLEAVKSPNGGCTQADSNTPCTGEGGG